MGAGKGVLVAGGVVACQKSSGSCPVGNIC